jgi:hypothetical protein
MSSCIIKLEFSLKSYMLFKLGKLLHIYAACFCIEFCQALLMPYERFVMLLKSRSRTLYLHMHYSYTGVGVKTCLPFRSTQKYFTPTLGVNKKICLLGFFIHQINVLSSCWYFSQSFVAERDMGLCKSYS